MKEDDILLIKECQAGQVSAFDRLVEIYRKQIYQLAYCITGNHEDADDISQETFVRAYRAMGDFKGKARFSTWLRRITINLSINHLKSESLRKDVVNDGEKLNDVKYVIQYKSAWLSGRRLMDRESGYAIREMLSVHKRGEWEDLRHWG